MADDHGEPTLLVVHHTPSPPTRELLEKVLEGTADPEITGVRVRPIAALAATVPDVLTADGFLFGTPANFGYMSGALKHFFDTVYYPVLGSVTGKPYGLWVHGNNDTAGAVASIQRLATGLDLEPAAAPVEITTLDPAARDACYELGAVLAATLA
jgi:multimeric flavodoxin WrbA